MARQIVIEVSDDAYRQLCQVARHAGESPEEWARKRLEILVPPATPAAKKQPEDFERLRHHVVSAPQALGSDNESIDRDLIREYENTHEES